MACTHISCTHTSTTSLCKAIVNCDQISLKMHFFNFSSGLNLGLEIKEMWKLIIYTFTSFKYHLLVSFFYIIKELFILCSHYFFHNPFFTAMYTIRICIVFKDWTHFYYGWYCIIHISNGLTWVCFVLFFFWFFILWGYRIAVEHGQRND